MSSRTVAAILRIAVPVLVLGYGPALLAQESTAPADQPVVAPEVSPDVTPGAQPEAQPEVKPAQRSSIKTPAPAAEPAPAAQPAAQPVAQPVAQPAADPAAEPVGPATEVGPVRVVGEEPPRDEGALQRLISSRRVKFEGSYGLHYTYMPTFGMDENGGHDGLKHYLDHRLNLRPTLILWQKSSPSQAAATGDATGTAASQGPASPDGERVELFIDVDLLGGQLAGSTSDAASSAALYPRSENDWTGRSMLRELRISWTSVAGRLDVGQIPAQWGLGMMFNSGRATDRDWTDNWGGDLIERLAFDTAPFAHFFRDSAAARAFHVMVAGDVVFMDEYSDLMDDDDAYGFTGALYFDHHPENAIWRTFSGVYVNYRWQEYSNGDRLEVTTADLFSEHEFRFAGRDSLKLAFEGAVSAGTTDRVLTSRAPDGQDILGWGLVARATYTYHKGIDASLEFGLASGDNDPGDDADSGFSFDPSYQVGMILFQDVLGRSTNWSASRASRSSLGYAPADGWEYSLSNGAVTNALYLHPQVKFYPARGLDIRLGFLWARALSPVASYYNSLVNGGYPLSFRGGAASRDLGLELDGGVYYTTPPIWKTLAVKLGLTAGWCRPGEAFSGSDGNGPGNLYKVRLGFDIVF